MGSLLLDLAIKGTFALLATGAVVALLRGASAASRHAVWTMGMGSALALPLLSRLLPGWSVDVMPAVVAVGPAAPGASPAFDWDLWLAFAWAAGAAIVVASLVVGRLRIWWIARRSAAIDHGEIPALATALCGEMGISRRVAVRLARERLMPMVWGVSRPVVLLPAEAATWPAELRRDVLLHELAHVRRHDYLNQLVARLACAVHWFNPLVWIAARRLRAERERACDDHVLGTGASACDYAAHLVAVARRMRPVGRGLAAVPMAGLSGFGERVAALLDARRARGVLTPGLLLRSGVGAACLVVPLAALHPGARPAADERPPGQLIGPPPSANARAAGALPEAESPASEEKAVEPARSTPRQGSARRPPRPASKAVPQASATRDGIPVVLVPVIRAVVERDGSAVLWSPGTPESRPGAASPAGFGDSKECEQSKSPTARPVMEERDPDLVWIRPAVATP